MVSENQPKKKEKTTTFYNHHVFVQTWKLSQFVLRVNSVDANIEILCKTWNPIFQKQDPERERESRCLLTSTSDGRGIRAITQRVSTPPIM
jgi:hypothetical protein